MEKVQILALYPKERMIKPLISFEEFLKEGRITKGITKKNHFLGLQTLQVLF